MVSTPAGEVGNDISRIRSRRPLQTEIRDAILSEYILSDKLRPGDRLPSEAELSRLFGASRVTIRTALQSLKDQGYIRIVRGSGSTVLPRPESINSGIDRLSSFDTYATQSGTEIFTDDVTIDQLDIADDPLADVFSLGPITRVSRTKKIGDKKVALIIDYVPEDVLSHASIQSMFKGSVLDLLLSENLAEYSDCTLTSVSASGDLRKKLGCPAGTPLLQLSELTRDRMGKVINRSEAWLLPDSFTFQLRRRRES